MYLGRRRRRRMSDSYQAVFNSRVSRQKRFGVHSAGSNGRCGLSARGHDGTSRRACTYLIAQLYSAGQLDGILILLSWFGNFVHQVRGSSPFLDRICRGPRVRTESLVRGNRQ